MTNPFRDQEKFMRACDQTVEGPPTGYTYGNVICEHFGVEE